MPFRIIALPRAAFADLFPLPDAELAARGARRVIADARPGFPCRVSLEDAEPGEIVLLTHFTHQPADTPFRASHAIYVREQSHEARCAPGTVPALFRHRQISLRGFDRADMLAAARLSPGDALAGAITAMFEDAAIAYIHLHYAAPGCYAAMAVRA